MGKKQFADDPNQTWLFEKLEPTAKSNKTLVKSIGCPIWTEKKARLIERYLNLFVFITKHGTYIDGFAGPQKIENSEMWSAKLVLETEPRWLKHFYLYETDETKVKRLIDLKNTAMATDPKRNIHVFPSDSNIGIRELLRSSSIKQSEATFCLLDQRTFECEWETVAALSNYKVEGNKIELFYFLANSWLDRTFAAQQDLEKIERWWGNSDWAKLRTMSSQSRANAFVKRFQEELGYNTVMPWPIFEKLNGGGNIMYYMIHATDHEEAPILMRRAYEKVVRVASPSRQLSFFS